MAFSRRVKLLKNPVAYILFAFEPPHMAFDVPVHAVVHDWPLEIAVP